MSCKYYCKQGDSDKVEEAIKVEYEKPLKNASIRRTRTEKESSEIKNDTYPDDDIDYSSSSDSLHDADEDHDNLEDFPSVQATKISEIDDNNNRRGLKKKVKNDNSETTRKPSISKNIDFVPDAFFAEEAEEAEEPSSSNIATSDNQYSSRGRGRGIIRGGRGRHSGGLLRAGRGAKEIFEAGVKSGELTKQEFRLLSWQHGVRGRGRRGGRGGSAGRSDKSDTIASEPNKTYSKSYGNETPSLVNNNRFHLTDKNKKRSFDSIGGAGRPLHNGVPTKQSIVISDKPQNKKIKFDE